MSRDHVSVTKKDLVVTYFRGSGSGGQKRNKTSNCVRIAHPDSGVVVEETKSRMQGANQKAALRKLADHPDFKAWVQTQMARPSDFLVEVEQTGPDGKKWWIPSSGVTEREMKLFDEAIEQQKK